MQHHLKINHNSLVAKDVVSTFVKFVTIFAILGPERLHHNARVFVSYFWGVGKWLRVENIACNHPRLTGQSKILKG